MLSCEFSLLGTVYVYTHVEKHHCTDIVCLLLAGSGHSSVRDYITWNDSTQRHAALGTRPTWHLHPHCR